MVENINDLSLSGRCGLLDLRKSKQNQKFWQKNIFDWHLDGWNPTGSFWEKKTLSIDFEISDHKEYGKSSSRFEKNFREVFCISND